jgi:hypothetical protein
VFRAFIVAFIALFSSAGFGAKIREARAFRICKDCNALIVELDKEKKLHGVYPTNAVALVKANATLHRKYFFLLRPAQHQWN